MTGALVREQTPEQREYDRYLVEVEVRKQAVGELTAVLEALRAGLARFEAEYHARVGTLFVELDRARIAVDEYELRIARLRANAAADPHSVEDEVRGTFGGRREEARQDEEETRRYGQEFARDQERPHLEGAEADEALQLYRDLARRHHPDLARTDEERRRREPLMRQVNAAFRDRDLRALRRLLHAATALDPTFETQSIGERLVWAIREVARLDDVVAGLGFQLGQLKASDSYALWLRHEAGERVIERLEEDLQGEVAALREQLADLILVYRQLVERRDR